MTAFRTKIELQPSVNRISHKNKILLNGSCFTDTIGQKLKELLFQVRINPFGVVYNPLSVLNSLGILLDGDEFTGEDLEFHNELWFSWDHHSSFSNPDKDECLNCINQEIKTSSRHLKKADFLLITFGTAWVYRLKNNGEVVSNCHKVPEKEFDRILLSVEDIVTSWKVFIPELVKKNKNLKIIFTVSPVRHLKDSAHGNQLSKSVLLLAIDELCRIFPDNSEYFPAYEILLDDLRDYRFYTDDLLHPNTQAVNYIWSIFEKVYFDKQTLEINKELEKLIQAKNHRVYNEKTEAYRSFREKIAVQTKQLSKKYPFLELKALV
jgi:hypothetical protein